MKTPTAASGAEMPEPAEADRKLGIREKLGFALGGAANNFILNAVNQLSLPLYNVGLGVDARWIGWALAIPRVIDAITDPLMGNISDNTRSRHGRRRPYILAGALLTGLCSLLLWIPPSGWGEFSLFIWFLVACTLYWLAYTLFIVPLMALGFELTTNYNERTVLQAWGAVCGLLTGLAIPWLYKLCLLTPAGNDVVGGARYVGSGLAIVIAALGVMPFFFCREVFAGAQTGKTPFWQSLRLTFSNRPFLIVMLTDTLAWISTFCCMPVLLYLNIYWISGGDKSAAATIMGWAGMTQMIGAVFGTLGNSWMANHTEKRTAVLVSLGVGVAGFLSYAVTLRPESPWLQLVSNFLYGYGIQGLWVLSASMVGDCTDHDASRTGLRREGAFGAVKGFLSKVAAAAAALLSGYIISWSGFVAGEMPGMDVISRLRWTFVGFQAAGLATAFVVMLWYPLSRARMGEIHRALAGRGLG